MRGPAHCGAWIALLAGALAAGSAPAIQDEAPEQPFGEEITSELLQVFVSVEGRAGKRLRPRDLELLDDGRPQAIVTLASGDVPFSALLVVDVSRSMAVRRLELAQRAARRFFAELGEFDRAGFVAFADRPREYVPIDAPAAEREARLAALGAGGGTAMYDAVALALLALEGEPGHRAVVLVSDGSDLHSHLGPEAVRSALRSSHVQLFWIRPRVGRSPAEREPLPGSWRTIEVARDDLRRLELLVEASGGRVFDVDGFPDLDRGVDRVLSALRHQLAIGYAPEPPLGSGLYRTWSVRLRDGRGAIRAPAGYFDSAPEPAPEAPAASD